MSGGYGYPEKRNKGKDKKREKKKNPYKRGGSLRSSGIKLSNDKEKK